MGNRDSEVGGRSMTGRRKFEVTVGGRGRRWHLEGRKTFRLESWGRGPSEHEKTRSTGDQFADLWVWSVKLPLARNQTAQEQDC